MKKKNKILLSILEFLILTCASTKKENYWIHNIFSKISTYKSTPGISKGMCSIPPSTISQSRFYAQTLTLQD